jgi:hypothetical protein
MTNQPPDPVAPLDRPEEILLRIERFTSLLAQVSHASTLVHPFVAAMHGLMNTLLYHPNLGEYFASERTSMLFRARQDMFAIDEMVVNAMRSCSQALVVLEFEIGRKIQDCRDVLGKP